MQALHVEDELQEAETVMFQMLGLTTPKKIDINDYY